jgi:hypothetical protein
MDRDECEHNQTQDQVPYKSAVSLTLVMGQPGFRLRHPEYMLHRPAAERDPEDPAERRGRGVGQEVLHVPGGFVDRHDLHVPPTGDPDLRGPCPTHLLPDRFPGQMESPARDRLSSARRDGPSARPRTANDTGTSKRPDSSTPVAMVPAKTRPSANLMSCLLRSPRPNGEIHFATSFGLARRTELQDLTQPFETAIKLFFGFRQILFAIWVLLNT